MVVFIDVNTREIHIYSDSGIRKIPFHDAHILTDIVGNQKINYVTNVMETTASEVVDLVRGISGQKPTARTQRMITPDLEVIQESTYLHSTRNGTLIIPDMDHNPAEGQKGFIRRALVRFEGPGDCKAFDDDMKEKIKKSSLLRNLVKKGTLEMVGEQKKNELVKLLKLEMGKKLARSSARDAALDAIIMDGKVGDWDGGIPGGDVAIEIDVGRRGIGGGGGAGSPSHGAISMSEFESALYGTG